MCRLQGAGRQLLDKSGDPTKALLCYMHTQGTDSLKAKTVAFFIPVHWVSGSVILRSHLYWTVTGVATIEVFPTDMVCARMKVTSK